MLKRLISPCENRIDGGSHPIASSARWMGTWMGWELLKLSKRMASPRWPHREHGKVLKNAHGKHGDPKMEVVYVSTIFQAIWIVCAVGKPEQSTTAPPLRSFKSFHSRWDVLRLLQLWLKAQAIQLVQGPIKPTGSIYRAQLGVKRCSGICLLVGTSGKGLGCSLTLEPVGYEPNPNAALKPCRAATSLSVVDKNVKFKRLLVLKKNARKRQMKSWFGFWKRWTHLEKNMGKKQGQDHQTRPEDHWRERELEKGEWHWPVLGEVEP